MIILIRKPHDTLPVLGKTGDPSQGYSIRTGNKIDFYLLSLRSANLYNK
jgi:hypothetical protein